jgi:hypothetical protein
MERNKIDLLGQKFGKLTVIEEAEPRIYDNGHRKNMWKCRCECGNVTIVPVDRLMGGHTKSCGCLRNEYLHKRHYKDLKGETFGKLYVVDLADIRDKYSHIYWHCKCECGNELNVSSTQLITGHTKSCGCLHKETLVQRNKKNAKHNMCNSRIYNIWGSINDRCRNSNSSNFENYGARGITVCDDWVGTNENGFINFYNWAMNNGYTDELSIDRIDVNGNYEPSNCRWATNKMQANNRRTSKILIVDGVSHTISEWSDITGICETTINNRIIRGWSDKDAVTKPPQKNTKKEHG